MAVAGFTLFGLGVILLICYPITKRKNSRCSAQTQGTLIDIRQRYNSDGSLPDMHVYSYNVNGIDYKIKSTAINPNVNKIGDQCTIWYNPSKPKDAQEFHYDSNKIYNIILISGIVLVLLGFILHVLGFALQK